MGTIQHKGATIMDQSQEKTFAAKHAADSAIDPDIQAAITKRVSNGEVPCAVAFDIARQLGVTPQAVGRTIDLLNFRLAKCQLGLFGYKPDKKIVRPAQTIDPQIEGLIRAALTDRRLPCRKAWEIASRLELRKMKVSSVCEALSIKIKPCQLGAF